LSLWSETLFILLAVALVLALVRMVDSQPAAPRGWTLTLGGGSALLLLTRSAALPMIAGLFIWLAVQLPRGRRGIGLGVLQALGFAVLTFVVVRVVRSEPVGALLVAGLMTFGLALRDQVADPALLVGVFAQCLLILWLLLRQGLLAYATTIVLTNMVLMYPTTRFGGSWLATGSTAMALMVPLVAAYGAWASARRGGPSPRRA
jgi:hypothetical protein